MVKSAVALGPRAQGPCCTQQATRLGPRATMQGGSHTCATMWWWCTVGNNPLDGRQTHVCIFCWQGGTVKEQIVCDSKILICYIVILITIFLILHMFAHPHSLCISPSTGKLMFLFSSCSPSLRHIVGFCRKTTR